MALCNSCGELTLPTNFETDCNLITKDCGIKFLYAALCSYEFSDLEQATFDAAVAAGAVTKFPSGLVTITTNTGTPIRVACDVYIPGSTTYTLTYVSYSMVDGTSMYEYWRDLYNAKTNLTLFWQGCDGLWFLNNEWADWNNDGASPGSAPTDEPIGYPANITTMPILQRDDTNELCTWNVTFEIKFNNVLVPTEIPDLAI
jgi:hypothetical protein